MAKETSKAMRRRWCEAERGEFRWRDVFAGTGIDVGSGDDPLPLDGCIAFDKKNGDANQLTDYFKPESFDYLHASQALEHMHDPVASLASWVAVVKQCGWVVVTVPDVVLYEGMRWPSRYNGDHKTTWSLHLKKSPCPRHVYVPDFLKHFESEVDVVLCRLLDCNYDYFIGTTHDQTQIESNGVEPWIEIVLQKNGTHPTSHRPRQSSASTR